MSAAQVAYWEQVLARVVETDDWKKDLESNFWEGQFLQSADTRKLLKTQYDEYKGVLIDVGLAR
jgi:putative tricarboxylic transport membrane protein